MLPRTWTAWHSEGRPSWLKKLIGVVDPAQIAKDLPWKSIPLWDLYRFSYTLAFRSLDRQHIKSVARLLLEPCTYWRNVEIPAVLNHLQVRPGERILDIGSPKLASIYLWYRLGAEVYATDLFPYFLDEYSHHLKRLGNAPFGTSCHLELQDARSLPYSNDYFHKVYAISVVEHIEQQGDIAAMREIGRVLRPGGVCCLTVPFAVQYHESTIENDKLYYKKPVDGKAVFYQRFYDPEALHARLIAPSGLQLTAIEYYGERWFPYEQFYESVPVFLRMLFWVLGPAFSKIFLYRMETNSHSSAKTVLLVLRKSQGRLVGAGNDGETCAASLES